MTTGEKDRYYFNRGELEIVHNQLQSGHPADLQSVRTWCCHLIQMVDKLYGQVATLEHELQQLKESRP